MSRSSRILNMILPEKEKREEDSHILEENHNLPSDQHLLNHDSSVIIGSEPPPTNLHDDSFDTDSIPDSQIGLDINFSFDDDIETELDNLKKPNLVIEESSSDSDKDSQTSSESDSSSSLGKTDNDFSSDDSVKDPDYQHNSSIESDSDNFSPKPGTSGVLFKQSSRLDNIDREALTSGKQPHDMINQLCEVNNSATFFDLQQSNNDIQSPSVLDTYLLNVDAQSANIDIQPTSVDSQLLSVDSQPVNVDIQVSSVDAQSPCVTSVFQCSSNNRKRRANPELWKKKRTKFLKNSGKAYTSLSKSKKIFEAKKMGPVCSDKCKLKCSTKFTDEERLSIFEAYWDTADLYVQRQFVHEHMTKITPKYRYTRVGSDRKNFNSAYYLPQNKERRRVCKIFFMHTLAISDKFIRTVQKKHSNTIGAQTKDNRGKHGTHNKTDTHLIDGIKMHIDSIPRIESHYCRAQTKREYIEGGTNVATLHRDYIEKCKSEGKDYATYQIYNNIFKTYNISFWRPKKDQCDDCVAFANAQDKAPLQEKHERHLKEKSLARAEKQRDKENVSDTFIVAVYDLQAVMPCPRGDVSSFYYIPKINLLNFTITELETKNTICYVWHEGEGARGVNELGSCVLMYLKRLHDKANAFFDVVFYSDNCCGQQKNKFMLAMYQYAIRELPKLRSITHKFLIKGHTQNEGDSVHSMIERNISNALKSSPIYVPHQYVTLIKTAKKKGPPYTVIELTHDNFFDLKPLGVGNYAVTDDGQKLRWSDIKVLKVDRENLNKFFFKTSYDDSEYKSVCTLTKRQSKSNFVAPTTLKKMYAQKLKVPETKTRGILNLIQKDVIPKFYEDFYINL